MLLFQAVQAANATKHLLALSNSETLPRPAPPPSSPPAAAAAPDVRLCPDRCDRHASDVQLKLGAFTLGSATPSD